MFGEVGVFEGHTQRRFAPWDWRLLPLGDLPSAQALVAHVSRLLREAGLGHRPPPPEPDTCCGRGCNGCVWEGFYDALGFWREDAIGLLAGSGPAQPPAGADSQGPIHRHKL
jgi:hypothetical protein